MQFLDKIIELISSFMTGPIFATVAVVLEMFMRLIKTDKPIGFIHMIAGILNKVGSLFSKLAELLDKLLPQKLK
jgi:hypothetical protein